MQILLTLAQSPVEEIPQNMLCLYVFSRALLQEALSYTAVQVPAVGREKRKEIYMLR